MTPDHQPEALARPDNDSLIDHELAMHLIIAPGGSRGFPFAPFPHHFPAIVPPFKGGFRGGFATLKLELL